MPNIQPKDDKQKAEEFVSAYNELCKKYKLQIVTNPAFRYSAETNDWRVVLQTSLGKMPKDD